MESKLFNALQEFQPAKVYSLAPKDYVERGYRYYAENKTLTLEWNKTQTKLTAYVQGNHVYRAYYLLQNGKLRMVCNCPVWDSENHCKHIICSLMTIKNLLNPVDFPLNHTDPSLHQQLRQQLLDNLSTENTVPNTEKPEMTVLIKKYFGDRFEFSVLVPGRSLTAGDKDFPAQLLPFTEYSYRTNHVISESELLKILQKIENHYSILFSVQDNKIPVVWDPHISWQGQIILDLDNEKNIKIEKAIWDPHKKIADVLILGSSLALDLRQKKIGTFQKKVAWDALQNFNLKFSMKENNQILISTQDYNKTPLTQSKQKPISEETLLLQKNGALLEPQSGEYDYKLVITSTENPDWLRLQAVMHYKNNPTNLLQILQPYLQQLNTAKLSSQRRRKALANCFLKLLHCATEEDGKIIITKCIEELDLVHYRLEKEVRNTFKDFFKNIVLDPQTQLMADENGWAWVPIDEKKAITLSMTPCILFAIGWEYPLFKEGIRIPQKEFLKQLSPLMEIMNQAGIPISLDNHPLNFTKLDFYFDASASHGIDWFEIHPEIYSNGKLISENQWREILQSVSGNTVQINGRLQLLDDPTFKILSKLQELLQQNPKTKRQKREIVQIPRLQIFDWLELEKLGVKIKLSPADQNIINSLKNFQNIPQQTLPESLQKTLRPYQKEGVNWLTFLYQHRFGACLADDMGLGKTLQVISFLAALQEKKIQSLSSKSTGPHLIVVPPSLVFNWENEFARFYPEMKIQVYAGGQRSQNAFQADVVITTYGILQRDIALLKNYQFQTVVFDEAQMIKNILASRTGAARQISAQFKICLTGTPLENHLGEYFSILDLAVPGLLSKHQALRPKTVSPETISAIVARTKPFVLRRKKENILSELPAKIEMDFYLELTDKQKAFYNRMVAEIRQTVETAYQQKNQAQAGIIALTAILKLRQICISPQIIDTHSTLESPKIDYLILKTQELLSENHSLLIFSQFVSTLDLLETELKKSAIRFFRLDGSTPQAQRKIAVETFQTAAEPAVFLISLKSGGFGLNLTKASYVFHLDPWWNPAVENQASDRAHRIGQKKQVFITRLIMRHTIEEKMMQLKKKKLKLFQEIVEETTAPSGTSPITKEDFDFLLSTPDS